MIDVREIKKNDRLLRKHQDAYNLGFLTDVKNDYPFNSEKYKVFNIGRMARIRKADHRVKD